MTTGFRRQASGHPAPVARDPDVATILLVTFTGVAAVASLPPALLRIKEHFRANARRRRANLQRIASWGGEVEAVRDHLRTVHAFLGEVMPRPRDIEKPDTPDIALTLDLNPVDWMRYRDLVRAGVKHIQSAHSATLTLISALSDAGESWRWMADTRLADLEKQLNTLAELREAMLSHLWGVGTIDDVFNNMERQLDGLIGLQKQLIRYVAD